MKQAKLINDIVNEFSENILLFSLTLMKKIEKLNYNLISEKRSSSRLPSFGRSVFFIQKKEDNFLSNEINENKKWFKGKFDKAKLNLINTSDIKMTGEIDDKILYIFPALTERKLEAIKNHFSNVFTYFNPSQFILNYFEYTGSIESGLLIIDHREREIVLAECINLQDAVLFTNNYIGSYLYSWEHLSNREADYMPSIRRPIDNIEIDDESKEAIDTILNGIKTISNNGDLIKILPFIENYLGVCKKNYLNSISHLHIQKDYTIALIGYKIEFKLSPLTMAIYLLYIKYPAGINSTDLHLYKNELLENYSKISSRADYDKIQKSIDDLIDPKSNALYVHFSRIKSAFIKHIHPDLAINYYIIGERNKAKYIQLNRDVVAFLPE